MLRKPFPADMERPLRAVTPPQLTGDAGVLHGSGGGHDDKFTVKGTRRADFAGATDGVVRVRAIFGTRPMAQLAVGDSSAGSRQLSQ